MKLVKTAMSHNNGTEIMQEILEKAFEIRFELRTKRGWKYEPYGR